MHFNIDLTDQHSETGAGRCVRHTCSEFRRALTGSLTPGAYWPLRIAAELYCYHGGIYRHVAFAGLGVPHRSASPAHSNSVSMVRVGEYKIFLSGKHCGCGPSGPLKHLWIIQFFLEYQWCADGNETENWNLLISLE